MVRWADVMCAAHEKVLRLTKAADANNFQTQISKGEKCDI